MNNIKVDYAKIADKYENNPVRHRNLIDGDLLNFIAECGSNPIKLLDVACGTGLYINLQQQYLESHSVEFHGLDEAPEMLAKAKAKIQYATFHQGKAEELPFASDCFDYVYSSYAFHHFSNKEKALDEMFRVIKPGGFLKIITISAEFLDHWYIYRFFPQCQLIDENRCWPAESLVCHLEKLGLEVSLHVEHIHRKIPATELYNIAKNRDISELVLLKDEEYKIGMKNLKRKAESGEVLSDIFAKVIVKAHKPRF